jgi:hypothetical protein
MHTESEARSSVDMRPRKQPTIEHEIGKISIFTFIFVGLLELGFVGGIIFMLWYYLGDQICSIASDTFVLVTTGSMSWELLHRIKYVCLGVGSLGVASTFLIGYLGKQKHVPMWAAATLIAVSVIFSVPLILWSDFGSAAVHLSNN